MRIAMRFGRLSGGFRLGSLVLLVLGVVSTMGRDGQARAGYVVSGQSGGVAISSNLSVTSLATANVSINSQQGSSPSPYNTTLANNAGATISAGAYNLPVLGTPEVLLSGTTGLLSSTVTSNIDGLSGSGFASGATTINNLNLKVLGTLGVPVVTITATTLTTTSTASGTFGALNSIGMPSFVGLSIFVLGVDVTALVQASDGILVNIAGLAGLQIGIDVKTFSGNGITSSGVLTDNIVVQFNNAVTLGGTLNGQLRIGESFASISASPVPEPSSVVMMGAGLLLTGAVGLKRGRRVSRGLTA